MVCHKDDQTIVETFTGRSVCLSVSICGGILQGLEKQGGT